MHLLLAALLLAGPKEMVEVPAGAFVRGCNAAVDRACEDDETPSKPTLPKFAIDRTEVTRKAFDLCVKAGACAAPTCAAAAPDHPVTCVTWEQARAYCAWAKKRLPTEAEWEKAARGADGRVWPWGNEPPTCERANFSECGEKPAATGSRPKGASPFGALDLAGNAWEWTADWLDGAERVRAVRGGGFVGDAAMLRTSYRMGVEPGSAEPVLGFRCAR